MLKFLIRAVIISLALMATAGHAAEVKVIAANAVKEGYADIVAAFEKSSGHKVVTTWAGTVATEKRVSAGDVFDIVLVGSDAIDRLINDGKLSKGSRIDVAKTGIALAIRAGLPKPDVSTPDAIKAAVLSSNSIAYSAGPSGAYVSGLLKRWGISDQVAGRIKQPSSGAEVAQILARGEADLAFAQASEFLGVAGIQNLGPVPAAIQNFTVYSAAQHAMSTAPDAAAALLKALKSQESAPAIRKMGMEPG